MKKIIVFLITCFILLSVSTLFVQAKTVNEQPYQNYIYNQWGESVPIPNAYEPERVITGNELNVGSFDKPEDMFIDKEAELIYVLDSLNSRIVVVDIDFHLQYIIDTFNIDPQYDDSANEYIEPRTLNTPMGIFVDDQYIYIADTENKRILLINKTLEDNQEAGNKSATVDHIIFAPDTSKLIDKTYEFKPEKIVVNQSGVIFALIRGLYEGAMIFEYNEETGVHEFVTFFGANDVQTTADVLLDYLWKRFLTEEQRARMNRSVPVQYNNFDIDQEGFLYTVTKDGMQSDQIRRLNLAGDNKLRNRHSIGGARFGDYEILWLDSAFYYNKFVAVDINDNGIITALDLEYGKLFLYDQESNLLSIFGGGGQGKYGPSARQKGSFQQPVDVESIGNRIYVLDKGKAAITYFEPTEFGSLIIEAVVLNQKGLYQEAVSKWEEVLQYSMNYELAYIGIGKAKYQLYEYEDAMKYFKLGADRASYSDAFEDYRQEFLRVHFGYVLLIIFAFIILIRLTFRYKEKILLYIFKNKKRVDKVKYPFYIFLHPIRGFHELMHYKMGSVLIANVIMLTYFFIQILSRQLTGFIFNFNRLDELNALTIFMSSVIIIMVWNVANWAFCTLANGKGKFKDIYITTAYSLMPLILFNLFNIVLSHVISSQEGMLLTYVNYIKNFWFVVMLTLANMTIHQYSFWKTIISMIITLIGVVLTVFLGVLIFGLFEQLSIFIQSILNELLFRL